MNDFIKMIKSLEDSGLLIDGVTEAVKYWIKNQEDRFLGASLVQPVSSSVVKGISGRRVRSAGRGYMNTQF